MLFGFADVPYTTPNAASEPKRTNTWLPPPSAVVGPVSWTSWQLISVAARAPGVARTAIPPVATKSKPIRIAFAFMENRTSCGSWAREGPFETFRAIVNPDCVQILERVGPRDDSESNHGAEGSLRKVLRTHDGTRARGRLGLSAARGQKPPKPDSTSRPLPA